MGEQLPRRTSTRILPLEPGANVQSLKERGNFWVGLALIVVEDQVSAQIHVNYDVTHLHAADCVHDHVYLYGIIFEDAS